MNVNVIRDCVFCGNNTAAPESHWKAPELPTCWTCTAKDMSELHVRQPFRNGHAAAPGGPWAAQQTGQNGGVRQTWSQTWADGSPLTPGRPPVKADDEPKRTLRVTTASKSKIKRVHWTWDGRIAEGTIALLAGREGLGKSLIAVWIIAQITKGTLPGRCYGMPRNVIVCASEDAWEEVIVGRLAAAGANLNYVHRVDIVEGELEAEVSLPRDVEAVRKLAIELGAAMLVLDPIISRLSGELDTHKDAEVRLALEPLKRMAEYTKMTILGIIHVNKSGRTDPIDAVMASRAFTAVARSVSVAMRNPEDQEGQRMFGTPKNNLGPDNLPSLVYSVEARVVGRDEEGDIWAAHIAWQGETKTTIREAMEQAAEEARGGRTQVKECTAWLGDYLAEWGGAAESEAIKAAADKEGFSVSTLHKARKKAKIEVESIAGVAPRRTRWILPAENSGDE